MDNRSSKGSVGIGSDIAAVVDVACGSSSDLSSTSIVTIELDLDLALVWMSI